MLIHEMPEVLTWKAPMPVLNRVYSAYVGLVSDAFGKMLQNARVHASDECKHLESAMNDCTDHELMRVLIAPETTFRLIWCRQTLAERALFLADAFTAEKLATENGAKIRVDGEFWTALGDRGFFPDGAHIESPQVEGLMPIDISSPYAASVDLGGPSGVEPRKPFTETELTAFLNKLREAKVGIERAGSVFSDFVRRFNLVLIAQKDNDDPLHFSSGSTGQYVGRSFITNPHLEKVQSAEVAEALVHEGIHSLLYMQERQKPWVLVPEYYEVTAQRIVSPWTGSVLGLRPFLQACFVWYGLLHFWSSAIQAGSFSELTIRARMFVALRGFLEGPLLDRIEMYRAGISEDVLAAIAAMQHQITESWAATGEKERLS